MKDGLFDRPRHSGTIVNNEFADIVRMLNSAFAGIVDQGPDFYPEDLAGEINNLNDSIYTDLNSGVYQVGFASSQGMRSFRSM